MTWSKSKPALLVRAHTLMAVQRHQRHCYSIIDGELSRCLRNYSTFPNYSTWLVFYYNPLLDVAFIYRHCLVFTNKWIGRNGQRRWPAGSPDLSKVDFFMKMRQKIVYKEMPATVVDMQQRLFMLLELLHLKFWKNV